MPDSVIRQLLAVPLGFDYFFGQQHTFIIAAKVSFWRKSGWGQPVYCTYFPVDSAGQMRLGAVLDRSQ
jgi:hypothetical protein